jgi:hypothetical protein
METDLLARLGLCLDPSSEAASGISAKALRSLGLDTQGLDEREKEHRENRRTKIKSELLPHAAVAGSPGAIPGLSPQEWVGEEGQFVIPIPWAALSIIAEKIARGCEYKLKDKYIEPPYAIRTYVTEPDVVSPLFLSHRREVNFGPGCQVLRVFATEEPNAVRYRILVWGTLCFHVLIDREEYLAKLDEQVHRVQGIVPPDGKMMIPPYLRELK